MKAAEAMVETVVNFIISVVEIINVDVLKRVRFEECALSPGFYIFLRAKNTPLCCFLCELNHFLFLFIYIGMNL